MQPHVLCALSMFTVACSVTSHPVVSSELGTPKPSAAMLAVLDAPGSVRIETVNSADWEVERAGLLNLKHAEAERAHLADGLEPVQVYFHVLVHPARGTYLVDTGVEKALRDDQEHAAISGLAAMAFKTERMKIHAPLGPWLSTQHVTLSGVLLTHLHADHVMGLPDVPPKTPIYVGPGEAAARSLLNVVVQPITNRMLKGHAALQELVFDAAPDARLSTLDLFDDGMVWALHAPGHTPGSLAFLVRTPEGPVLLTGDTCHTAWGWEHDVEPGEFTSDHEANARSLAQLRRLVREHPAIQVKLGHQAMAVANAQP